MEEDLTKLALEEFEKKDLSLLAALVTTKELGQPLESAGYNEQ